MTETGSLPPRKPDRPAAGRFRYEAAPDSPKARLGHRPAVAWFSILWETLWPRLWPAASIFGIFLALALFDIIPDLAGWQHVAILAAFGLGFAAAIWHAGRGFTLPTREQVRRRIEKDSAFEHRPLETVEDSLAVGSSDPAVEAMWQAHQARARAALGGLRVGGPRPQVARLDRFALRGAVLLLLAVALTFGWGDGQTRMARMFMPSFDPVTDVQVTVEAWITPPGYTGLAPRMVSAEDARKPIEIPAGSRIMLQVHGGRGTPTLDFGRQRMTLQALDETSHQAELYAFFDGRITVTQRGRDVVDWEVKILPDSPPKIDFVKDPSFTDRLALRLDYEASDDFRLKEIHAHIARDGEADVITLPLPGAGGRQVKTNSFHDLTGHRWAGLPVSVILEAVDDRGQRGQSRIADVTLPERRFDNPVARAIVEQRKLLTTDPQNSFDVIRALGRLADNPDLFLRDSVVYLGLRVSQSRLIIGSNEDGRNDADLRADTRAAIHEVQPLLWDIALRIEEGRLTQAERELRRIERELKDKLSETEPPSEEVKKLLEELRKAMEDYLKALREDMARNPQKYQDRPTDPDQRSYSEQDMNRLMEQMQKMLGNDKKALEKMLSQLREMMENLRKGGNDQAEQLDPNHPAQRMMRELADIIRKQRDLMDETFRRGEDQRDGGKRDPEADKRAEAEQEKLRQRLGELMRQLGEQTGKVPENLGDAEQEMRRSQRELQQGRPGQAVPPQSRALEQLQRGGQQAMRQLAEQFGLRFGPGRQAGERPGREADRDPLGRRMEGMGPLNNEDVKVPSESERRRVEDILRELRQRAADPNRPQLERDYLDRLLRQF